MPALIFKRAVFTLIVFAAMLSAVLAQSSNLQGVKEDGRASDLDFAYYNKQIADYSDAIKTKPNDAELYYGRGATQAYIKQYDEALKDYLKALELNKNFDKPYIGIGEIYVDKQQYEEAINAFNKAIEINPANDRARQQRDFYLDRLNKANALIQKINEQLKSTPLDLELYSLRAATYTKIGKKNQAEADLKKFQELDDILKKSILAECASIDYDCQIDIYTEKIKITRDTRFQNKLFQLYAGRGRAYYEKDDLDNALSDFKEAAKNRGSGAINMSIDIGNINLRKGKYDEVLRAFVCEKKARDADVSLICGKVHLYKSNYDKAFEYFEEAIQLSPGSAKAYLGRGTIYLERARYYAETENDAVKSAEAYRKAIKDFGSVIEIDLAKTPSEVYVKRAKAFERLGEQAKADADRAKAEETAEKP